MNDKVLISKEDLQYLEACEFTLYQVNRPVGLCPNCKKAILIDGLICLNCGYDNSHV